MRSPTRSTADDDPTPPGPYDPEGAEDLWFLPQEEPHDEPAVRIARGLVDAAAWKAAEGALAGDLAELAFDAGRLAERVAVAGPKSGPGAVQRLALAEAASLSWWSGDRVAEDRLALWLSYRIGATDDGGAGLIRTAWAARRLAAAGQGADAAAVLAQVLGEGRVDAGLVADVAAGLDPLAGASAVTRGCALCHLWRSLDERPDHLRGLEAAVLGARVAVLQSAAGQRKAMPFLPLTLTGFSALTAGGSPEARLAGWIGGAHRAVLSALMLLDRLAAWRARAEAATSDLQGRTSARLIAALAAHPMLAAPQAAADTGASRAAVQRNLDLLVDRGLAREVTGQGRFRVWAAAL